jgi:hypothetical protein
MATLDEIAKSFANNPVLKALDGLSLAAYSMPPGIANMSNAFDAISKLAAPSKDIANLMKYNSIGSDIVNAGLIGSGIGAIATSFHKEHAKLFDSMRMVSESNKLFSQTIAAAVGRPATELHELMQFASRGLNTSAIGSLTPLPAVKFESRPIQTDRESLRSIKQPERAPYYSDRAPASEPSLLPPDVEQSYIYFGTLISKLRALPAPDIIRTLDWLLNREEQADRALFLERLAHYIADGKGFAPNCWEVVTFWLKTTRRVQLTPTWHHIAATDAAPIPTSLFDSLLIGYTLQQLIQLLTKLGLLTQDGQAAPAATPGAWVGVIHALLDAEPPRVRDNKAGIGRALREVFGADIKERTAQSGLGKNGSEAEKVRDRALAILRQG